MISGSNVEEGYSRIKSVKKMIREDSGEFNVPATFVYIDRLLISDAGKQVLSGEAEKESFDKFVPIWIENASIGSACELVRFGFAKKEDFLPRLPEWIAAATPKMAIGMIDQGLADVKDFAGKLALWLRHPQYSYIRDYAMEHCGDDDISDEQVERWIAFANQRSALQLVEDGIATRDDFLMRSPDFRFFELRDGFVKTLTAPDMVPQKFCDAAEMRNQLMRAKDRITPPIAEELIRAGVIVPADVADLADLWKGTLLPETLPAAIRLGVVSMDEAWNLCRLWGDGRAISDPQFVKHAKEKVMSSFKEGDSVIARVIGTSEHASFVTFCGVKTALAIPDITWERNVSNGKTLLKYGQLLKCKIVKIKHKVNSGKTCFTLDAKDESENPWPSIIERFPPWTKVHGKVCKVMDYGIFVEIAPGVVGMVYRGEISWKSRKVNVASLYHEGDEVDVVVLGVNEKKRVISLSVKQLTKCPWDEIVERFPPGTRVKGNVVEKRSYGVMVELEQGLVGLLHHNDMSWDNRPKAKEERVGKYNVGDEVEVVVLSYSVPERHFCLGVKQLTPDPWETVAERFPEGKKVRGEVVDVCKFGLFVELAHGVVGLVHVSQLKQKGRAAKKYAVGDKIDVIVQSTDPVQRRICLGLKKPKAVARRLRPVQDDEDDDLGKES